MQVPPPRRQSPRDFATPLVYVESQVLGQASLRRMPQPTAEEQLLALGRSQALGVQAWRGVRWQRQRRRGRERLLGRWQHLQWLLAPQQAPAYGGQHLERLLEQWRQTSG